MYYFYASTYVILKKQKQKKGRLHEFFKQIKKFVIQDFINSFS